VIGVLFLELHGYEFKASEEDAMQAVMGWRRGRSMKPPTLFGCVSM